MYTELKRELLYFICYLVVYIILTEQPEREMHGAKLAG